MRPEIGLVAISPGPYPHTSNANLYRAAGHSYLLRKRPAFLRRIALAHLLAMPAALGLADAAQLPDGRRTPGDIATTNVADVCRPGYAHAARNVPYRVRDAVYNAYGLRRGHRTPGGGYRGPRHAYVIDHLVPLELGGANDARNLWPQPRGEARQKDRVEDELHDAVCAGRMRLSDAQRRIARDWQHAVPASAWSTARP